VALGSKTVTELDLGPTAELDAEETAMTSSVFFLVPDAEMEYEKLVVVAPDDSAKLRVFLFPASVGSEGSGAWLRCRLPPARRCGR
jgi:hypothetical protein